MKHPLPLLLLLCLPLTLPAQAQTTGTCAEAQAQAFLEVNNVRARIFNNGALFWKGIPSVFPVTYHVPKADSIGAVFNASLWVGGLVNGTLRVVSPRYNRWEFWPGPLDDQGNPPVDCTPFDRLYEITRDDIITFDTTDHVTDNLHDWPWHLGAPVLDGDGVADNYNLDGGDRPALMGDQMLWWVMNDAGNIHQTSESLPMGLEVHASAFAYAAARSSPFSYTTFYRYRLHYKGHAALESAYIALFLDPDLGNFDDDYVGADTSLAMGFVYNSDNLDEGHDGYGINPPALGAMLLQGPIALPDHRDNDCDGLIDEPGERHKMTAFTTAHVEVHERSRSHEAYNSMRGLTPGGTPIYEGWGTGDITPIMLAGDPVTGQFWSEVNGDGQGRPVAAHDKKMLISSGPFTMQPGDEQEILYALVWSRGTDYLDSVRQLKIDAARIRTVAEQVLQPNATFPMPRPEPSPSPVLGFAGNYPNPFAEVTTIRYSLPKAVHVQLTVYDALGREVSLLVNSIQQAGIYSVNFDARAVPTGVYIARFEVDGTSFTRPMMVLR